MLGLFAFVIGFVGFGRLLPVLSLDGTRLYGFRYFGGGLLFVFAFYFLHIILRIDLSISAWLVMGSAGLGVLWSLVDYLRQSERDIHQWLHPIPLLILTAVGCILVNNGIGYLPYSGDEFTNWIGISRQIFMAGNYADIADNIWLYGYTPGWRLMLLFPWVLTSSISEGNSAALPFVMMVGLAGILYDIVRWKLSALPGITERRMSIFAWGLTLIGLSAQIAGPTWMRNLLIEQPQIYTLSVCAIAISLIPYAKNSGHIFAFYAGLALAGSYMFKAAALSFAPSVGLAILILSFTGSSSWTEISRRLIGFVILVFAPVVVCLLSWKWYTHSFPPAFLSVFQTLSSEYIANALTMDWRDLASRFSSAVWAYITVYKWPLTVFSLLALLGSAVRGRIVPLLLWAGFFVTYMLALYWYHLGALGSYYFDNLNSVERFTRIPLQILHTLGFVIAVIEILGLMAEKRLAGIGTILSGRTIGVLSILAVAGLGAYQAKQIMRSVVDVTTRAYQNVDPGINEAKQAVEAAIRYLQDERLNNPTILIISQGTHPEVLNYARYFAQGLRRKGGKPIDILFDGVSWTPNEPVNTWQHKISANKMRAKILASDMIWPIKTDPWIISVLTPLVGDPACLDKPLDNFFIRKIQGDGSPGYICHSKAN